MTYAERIGLFVKARVRLRMSRMRSLAVTCALFVVSCAGSAQSVTAPVAPVASTTPEPRSYLGCWRPRPPAGPLRGVTMICFERDRYWFFMTTRWDGARLTTEATSETSWRLTRGEKDEIALALESDALSFTSGGLRAMLERPSAEEQRVTLDRIASLPTIESLCDRARRCIDAAGARMPDEEDDTEHLLASTCIHDVEDLVALLRQRGRDVPRECG